MKANYWVKKWEEYQTSFLAERERFRTYAAQHPEIPFGSSRDDQDPIEINRRNVQVLLHLLKTYASNYHRVTIMHDVIRGEGYTTSLRLPLCAPKIVSFFTGHWNRHHTHAVRTMLNENFPDFGSNVFDTGIYQKFIKDDQYNIPGRTY